MKIELVIIKACCIRADCCSNVQSRVWFRLCSRSLISSLVCYWRLTLYFYIQTHTLSCKGDITVTVGNKTSYWLLKSTFKIRTIIIFEAVHTYNCQWVFICVYVYQGIINYAKIFERNLVIPVVLNSRKNIRNKFLHESQAHKIAIPCFLQLLVIFEEPTPKASIFC